MVCLHDPCTCEVPEGQSHCAPTCRTGVSTTDTDGCFCGHEACSASSGEAQI